MGAKQKIKLLQHFSTIEQLYNAKEEEILGVPGIGKAYANIILNKELRQNIDKHLEFMLKHNMDIISKEEKQYPQI